MTILDEILEVKKKEVKILRRDYSYSRLSDSGFFDNECLSLSQAIDNNSVSIIAEIKKASPSKRIIREDFNHLKISDQYQENGANAISILTDEKFFMGSRNFMSDIARIKTIPLLRKDFIIDEYQVLESKSIGADAVLLIAEALSKTQIADLSSAAHELEMDILLELHSGDQIEKLDFELNKIIGINNRDLKTFNVDLQTTIDLSQQLPNNVLLVSESGISSEDDIAKLKVINTKAVLVGEHFMKSKNIGDALKEFKEWCEE